jgi:hypothetical protein
LLLCLAVVPLTLFGWGRDAHRLIARHAWTMTTAKTQAAITGLLEPGETLESISTWADEIRPKRPETGAWHYINIPVTAKRGDWKAYCPEAGCIVGKIESFSATLGDASLSRAQRAEALKFVVHLVSDLHQPLHTADRGDRGGNSVQVVVDNRATNLHSAWDSGILLASLRRHPELQQQLDRPLGADERETLAAGTLADWIWETQEVSIHAAYGPLPDGSPAILDAKYQASAFAATNLQIRRAAARLARILDTTLGQ